MRLKDIGIIGMLIPAYFIVAFLIYIFVVNPEAIETLDDISIAAYNIENNKGIFWVRYINYVGLGVLILIFCSALLYQEKIQETNRISLIILLLSGLLWTSLGIFGITQNGDNFESTFFIVRIPLILILGSTGFLLMSNELMRIVNDKPLKWILFFFGIAIIINGVLELILLENYPHYLTYLSWIIYFLGFSVIGIGLIKASDYSTK